MQSGACSRNRHLVRAAGEEAGDFLDSLREWWEEKGYLTQRQFQALRKAAS